ncbi:tRNA (adenosine(37)-N6)-threonylcarbamoyltransferase complex ATPase subunit type 1 TsaE [Malaciobacter marinus]|uniref:tRNA threonylcarbamoyladenosine biosynthesis protein TsaE n=1 Tax=Malaciobacter marinus TaxID=505249 RepID=A0A347TKD8_9BACT|nr:MULTISPECIES: tRNA (adenosine(37)-N6)-threonylcarbamoyltransferase complex ATPase subunit type 1 TsaE [Malaciobacter]AXX87066.1 N6-L-threonylcarbamoyladenine synthase, TsaE subunit [Malaciobacter marinus]PHO12090.1 tRNA (adenosine(37)-N6)-threonylcarbamoyltransferase complex ATPase subunit type 1 TsaE [Malaciobacter marinus]PHO15171.1 tRNA (adenosine(37)-N6)-threonylcarbamoyltransferase complex ATPase subunit type 1 TsaE [Malaciobacter marinus]RYA22753.1 tRNA (adenosine(37)-N6)-threonylcarba
MQEKLDLNLEQLEKIVELVDKYIKQKGDCVILLQGDLASGKTTLVKNYVKSKSIEDVVTSPTFSIQTIYSNNIYHYDVYNKGLEEFISLGLLEEFEKEGIHFVEWGDERLEELLHSYGFNVITIKIEKKENKRQYTINA